MSLDNASLIIQKDKLLKELEENFSYNTRMYVTIGVGVNLVAYIQDYYLDPFSLKKIKELLSSFAQKNSVPLDIREVGRTELCKKGRTK